MTKKKKKRIKKRRTKNKQGSSKKKRQPILVYFLYLIGISIALYPVISNLYFKNIQKDITKTYQEQQRMVSKEELAKQKKQTSDYNQDLSDTFAQSFDMPDFNVDPLSLLEGVDKRQVGETLGIVSIPKIRVNLPIYNGTNDAQLKNGAGLLSGTSLPQGGKSTHSVITAHRGLPSAKLFTDLPKLEIGDYFFIETLGEKLAYQVDQITVIKPEEVDKLKIVSGEDYVTLLTCTPYMVNTHRLLVRGVATEYKVENEKEAIAQGNQDLTKTVILITLLIVLFLLIGYYLKKRQTKKKAKERK